jgi:hypothetical protein
MMNEAKAGATKPTTAHHPGSTCSAIPGQAAMPFNPAWRLTRPFPWPYEPDQTSPLAWWRRLPSDLFHDAERSLLLATLGNVRVLHGGDDLGAALRGDAAAAVGAALSLMPIMEITLPVDITMTSLLHTALQHDATSALVMAQIVGLTDLGHEYATELAASWFEYGRRHSDNPRKFSLAEDVLLAAFRGRQNQDLGA